MAPTPNTFALQKAGSASYWGYKAFQAMRVCCGDVTAIAEISAELIGEGLIAGARENPEMVVDAVKSMISLKGGVKTFRKSVTNFAQFSSALSAQLAERGDIADSAVLANAERIYKMFTECDTDGSGGVSLEEYVVFCGREGVPRDTAKTMFFQSDVDGNGQISFEEWTAMMNGRVGRDKHSINCGGQHGLTLYTAPYNGLTCDFCGKSIPAGSRAKGCRRCDCDACAACSGIAPAAPSRKPSKGAAPRSTPSAPPVPPRPALTTANENLNCHGGHGLVSLIASTSMSCDWCKCTIASRSSAVGCRICDCDACSSCVSAHLARFCAHLITCPGRHGLTLNKASVSGYTCDYCQRGISRRDLLYSCRLCQVDACMGCMWNDYQRAVSSGGAFTCGGSHELQGVHIMSYHQISLHKCSWCLQPPKLGDRVLWCLPCREGVCSVCLANGSNRAGVIGAVTAKREAPAAHGRPLPPSYDDAVPQVKTNEFLPPSYDDMQVMSTPQAPPPAYDDVEEGQAKPKVKSRRKVRKSTKATKAEAFVPDSVVRVTGVDDEKINGKLMTVISAGEGGGCGEVLLQRKKKVYRVSASCVRPIVS